MTLCWNEQYIIKGKTFFQNLVSQLDIEVSSFLSFFELDAFCIVSIIPFYEEFVN